MDAEPESLFLLEKLPDELILEVFSHLGQADRLKVSLVGRRCNRIATKLIYRRIYLNDSNVVRSGYMNLAINWTLLNIPSFLNEADSRKIANAKLSRLIYALEANQQALKSVEWIRINWDLDSELQRTVLSILCSKGTSLRRLENITDPSCNDIIANGAVSSRKVTSLDMAPPNALPEITVPGDYIPNLQRYLRARISTSLSHMTLFIDPVKLFNYLYPLTHKLQIVDLKLHWRREFYDSSYFSKRLKTPPIKKLSDVFEVRTLKTLTIISWNETLASREIQMIKDFREFVYLEDLSLISIKQNLDVLVTLFNKLQRLKRLKMDFLEESMPETKNCEIFLTILLVCKKLQFIDMRFEGLDPEMIAIHETEFHLSQKCYCDTCVHVFENILKRKIFLFPKDSNLTDIHDIAAKDIFRMMRYLSLLPYSKACDCYPSVRTQPMNLDEFVLRMNRNLLFYRQTRGQLLNPDEQIPNAQSDEFSSLGLPHALLTRKDVVQCYHALIHHYKATYVAFLRGFPHLRFLVLNDIPTIVVEEDQERVLQPIFYHENYETNLTGWSKLDMRPKGTNGEVVDAVTRKFSVF